MNRVDKHMEETVKNNMIHIIGFLLYFAAPALLIYAPFHKGEYSFYNGLRFFIFLYCLMLFIFSIGVVVESRLRDNQIKQYFVTLVTIAILFNPIEPIHMTRTMWAVADIASSIALIYLFFLVKKGFKQTQR